MDLGPASIDLEILLTARFLQTRKIIGEELQMQTLTNYYCETILQKLLVKKKLIKLQLMSTVNGSR